MKPSKENTMNVQGEKISELEKKVKEQEIDLKNVRKRYSNHKEKIKNFELLNLLTKKLNYNEEDFNKIIEDTNNSKNDSCKIKAN